MTRAILVVPAVLLLVMGCVSGARYPISPESAVDVTKPGVKIVQTTAGGSDSGFRLFGLIPFSSATVEGAAEDMWVSSGLPRDKGYALVNVSAEENTLFVLLFSIEKLSILGTIVEGRSLPPAR